MSVFFYCKNIVSPSIMTIIFIFNVWKFSDCCLLQMVNGFKYLTSQVSRYLILTGVVSHRAVKPVMVKTFPRELYGKIALLIWEIKDCNAAKRS